MGDIWHAQKWKCPPQTKPPIPQPALHHASCSSPNGGGETCGEQMLTSMASCVDGNLRIMEMQWKGVVNITWLHIMNLQVKW